MLDCTKEAVIVDENTTEWPVPKLKVTDKYLHYTDTYLFRKKKRNELFAVNLFSITT
jgi:hypothetical protein